MNRNILKKYAPQARRDFIQAVTDRASYYGLTKKKTEPVTVEADVAVIAGRAFPKKVGGQRKQLEERVARQGFDQVMEAMAYTWFNRLVAIRFMELHGYLEHGYRVLSHPSGGSTPEILEHADSVDLPGLDQQQVINLKLAGDKDAELYRMLLIAQCNALHKAMPFLFERIDHETELLLPDNLLHSDSLIRTLVNEIPEEDWQEVEIIGWLYQFYISEKKDQVIGKVVKSEDIPAATQLFTPNWIVKYLVQNSLGRQWVATYPNSPLKGEMEYYIEPAEQTPEVQEQLKAITPDKLDPEELTLLDPACGSGHILVEAYDLFKAIYLERGYPKKDIPRLILEKNLYGLEIDDRAAQLASLALMMKARADDRRIFAQGIQPHVLSIQESKGLDAKEITEALNAPILMTELPPSGELFEEIAEEKSPLFSRKNLSVKGDIVQADIARLIDLFEHGKTFGSLIQVPEELADKLPAIAKRVDDVIAHGGMFEQSAAKGLRSLLTQAGVLANEYDAAVTNPPYMGTNGLNGVLKEFAAKEYPESKADLFAQFIDRCFHFARPHGFISMITMHGWMFLASFKGIRRQLLESKTVSIDAHLGPRAFSTISGQVVQTCAFTCHNFRISAYVPTFFRLIDGNEDDKRVELLANNSRYSEFTQEEFLELPGHPLAYWLSRKAFGSFKGSMIGNLAESGGRCKTHQDERYVRYVWEVSRGCVGDGCKWKHYEKGGKTRKYFGNRRFVVDWTASARDFYASHGGLSNSKYWGREGLCWSDIAAGTGGFRVKESDAEFGSKSPTLIFPSSTCDKFVLGFLNSPIAAHFLEVINPSFQINVGDVLKLPLPTVNDSQRSEVEARVSRAIEISRDDWNSCEEAWGFEMSPLLTSKTGRVESSFKSWQDTCRSRLSELMTIEKDNGHFFVDLFALDGKVTASVTKEEITLYRPNREEDIQRLISYAIGCMMGRYSLDEPGLIYAHSGGEGFDPSQYQTFSADSDGIIPITEFEWFEDDAANRLEEFIATAWPKDHLEENLKFIAESIGQKKSESARDAIRRYLAASGAGGFYRHHLSLYKKRPIYWLFSSGKQRAFQCLIYLHRYNAGTLARMRTEYVIPLTGKIDARIEQLTGDIAAASSTSHAKKLTKERDTLIKHSQELQKFDEKLKHYADQRIELDLDDGVKVNYGKFGDLLAEVKAITGNKPEE